MKNDFTLPEETLTISGMLKKTLTIYGKKIYLLLPLAMLVYFMYRYYLLMIMPGVEIWLHSVYEFAKTSLFYNIYNAIGSLFIMLNNLDNAQLWKPFLMANMRAIMLALAVQPFVFGTITLITAETFREPGRKLSVTIKETALQYLRYFKLSFTLLYMNVILMFMLGMILAVLIAVGATLSSSLNLFTFWVMFTLSALLSVPNFFAGMSYAVMTFEGKLSYRSIGRSISIASANKLKTLAVLGSISLLQFAAIAVVRLMPIFPGAPLVLLGVETVLMPLPFIAAVCLYIGIMQDRKDKGLAL